MVKQYNKIGASLLLGIISLQMIVPFLLSLSILLVSLLQQNIVNNAKNTALFQRMVISEHDANLHLLNKKEFRYKGVMYDIKSIAKEKGDYVIVAVEDKHETSLCKLNEKHNEDTHKQASSHSKSFPFLFLFFEKTNTYPLSSRYSNEPFITYYNDYSGFAFRKIITPPPQSRKELFIS